jgi:hypothetical protein
MKSQHLQDSTFFMLTPGVRDRLMEINLTAAEWRMWCYLVSLDPFGDRGAKFSPAELMLKCQIKKTTYFSAKAKFQKLGLFDFRDGVTKVVNLQTSLVQTASEHPLPAKIIESEISESKSEISESKSEISESKSEISDNQSLKPKPSNVSKPPQTLQTYSDFKRSLSEGEREKFFNFVEEKTNNLERPINDLEAWLASENKAKQNRWEIYYRSFQEEQINESRKTTRHSENGESSPLGEKNSAIAKFRQKMRIDELVDEPVDTNSNGRLLGGNLPTQNTTEEFQQQQAEFNKLLDNPPEPGEPRERKSLAQQRREQIAKAKQQQEEWQRANKEAAEERAKQQNFDIDGYQAEIQRQIEEFNRLHNIGNFDENDEENLEDE